MKDEIIKLLNEKAADGYNETIEVIPAHKFDEVAQEIVKLLPIPDVVFSEAELPCGDIKEFAMFVIKIANRAAGKNRRKSYLMTKEVAEELINNLWKNYKFNTPMPQGN